MTLGEPAIFISYKRDHEPSLAVVTELEAELVGSGFVVATTVPNRGMFAGNGRMQGAVARC